MKKLLKLGAVGAMLLSGQAFAQCDTTFSAWDTVSNGNGSGTAMTATTNNPLSGSCSLEIPVAAGKKYVQDDMDQETTFRGSFQIDPNSIDIPTAGSGRKIKVHNVQCAGGCAANMGVDWFQAKMRKQPTGYKLGVWAQEADGNKISNTLDLVDGCNTVEYQITAGNPGTYKVWINNTTEASPDIDTTGDFTGRYTDRVRLGRMGQGVNINANASGESFHSDTFESRRQTFIGNSCAP